MATKLTPVTVRLTDDDNIKLRQVCVDCGLTLADWVRRHIRIDWTRVNNPQPIVLRRCPKKPKSAGSSAGSSSGNSANVGASAASQPAPVTVVNQTTVVAPKISLNGLRLGASPESIIDGFSYFVRCNDDSFTPEQIIVGIRYADRAKRSEWLGDKIVDLRLAGALVDTIEPEEPLAAIAVERFNTVGQEIADKMIAEGHPAEEVSEFIALLTAYCRM